MDNELGRAAAGEDGASRLRALLAAGTAVTYAVTVASEPTLTFISDNLLDRFGVDPGSLREGASAWYDRVSVGARQEALDALARVRPNEPARVEYRFLRPDGQWRWVADERVALLAPDGSVSEVVGTWTDITERRASRDAESDAGRLAHSVLDSIPALVACVDADQRYVYANHQYAELVGWTAETIRGATVREVVGPERYEWSRPHIERALRGERADFDADAPDNRPGADRARVMYGPRIGADGAIVGYYVVVTDASELTRAQAALRASEGRLAAIVDTAADGIITATEDGVVESLNAAAQRMFGFNADQGVGKNIDVLMPPAEAMEHADTISRYLAGAEARFVGVGRVVRGQKHDGSIFPLHISLSDAALPDGRRFTAIMRDMTEEVRLTEELRALTEDLEQRVASRTAALEREAADRKAAEEGLRHVLAGAKCILWRASVQQDVDGGMRWDVTFLDDEAAQRLVPLDLSNGTPWHTASVDARVPEDHTRICAFVDNALRNGDPAYGQEFRLIDVHGDVRWLQEDVVVEPVGPSHWHLVGVMTEVTQRKDADAALRRVLASARCLLWRADVEDIDGVLRWNPTPLAVDAAQAFLPLDLTGGRSWHTAGIESRFPEDSARMGLNADAALRNGRDSYGHDFRVTDAHGRVRWLHEDVFVERDGPGQWSLTGVAMDITDRKRAEEELRRSEEHFRRIFDGNPTGVAITDSDLRLIDANPALCTMLGYERSELIGRTMGQITHPDDLQASATAAARLASPQRPSSQARKRYLRKDGSAVWAQTLAGQLHDAAGQVVGRVGIIEDITARRRSESLRAALHDISEAVHVSADLPELVRKIGGCIGQIMDAEDFAVGLTDRDSVAITRWLTMQGDYVVSPETIACTRAGWVMREQRSLFLTRADTRRRVEAGELALEEQDMGSWCGAPLVVGGQAIGVVRARSNERAEAYGDDDRDFLDFVASQIALAVSRKRAEEELLQERRLFDELMENAPESIYFKDADARFVRVSERDAARLGVASAREMVGMSDLDFWPAADAERLQREEEDVMQSGMPMVDRVTRHPSADGADTWWSTTKIPLADTDGRAKGIIGIGRDVTALMGAQEALRESEAQRTRLMQQILVVQEEERARIARELHDQVGQDLASVLIGLRIVAAAEDIETARTEASMLRERTAATLEDVRQIAFDMRPSSLDDLGLMVALERALTDLAAKSGFEPAMRVHGTPGRPMRPDVELGIYRVIHAAIANAARHGEPRSVSITTRFGERSVSFLVEDDGCGFDAESVLSGPVEDRFGLLAMQERAQIFHGELTIDSTPGEGTAVILDVGLAP